MLQIGINQRMKDGYFKEAEIKRNAILESIEFFKKFELNTTAKELVANGFLNDFETKYIKEYSKHCPKYLNGLEVLKYANVETAFLSIRQTLYNSYLSPFDIETLSVPGDIDFGIYLDELQAKKWKALNDLEKAITEFQSNFNGYDFINFGSIPIQLNHRKNQFLQV
jgi:hypothetical protein